MGRPGRGPGLRGGPALKRTTRAAEPLRWDLALGVLLGLVLLSEAVLALGSAGLWRSLDRLELVDRPLLRDHRAGLGAVDPAAAVILGDSVTYGSALREAAGGAWRSHSLGQALRDRFQSLGRAGLELSGDGLYPADLEALWSLHGPGRRGPVVLQLNPRMFAAEAGAPASAYSRRFLDPAHRPDAADRVSGFSHLFRYCRLASHLLWQPSRAQALSAALDRALPPRRDPAEDLDLGDALLNMKIQPYYSAPAMGPEHAGLRALERLAASLRRHPGPVLVFLTPQNRERIEDVLDGPAYQANRRTLKALFRRQGVAYRDWADHAPEPGAFLDHCHLDAEGNAWLAGRVLEALPR